jgi:hypothetical protein
MAELSNKYRHYRLYERDRREWSAEFVARAIAEEEGDVLLEERNGYLHYLNQFSDDGYTVPLIWELRCESWDSGIDFNDLVKNAQGWIDDVCQGRAPALLASPPEIEEQHEFSGYEGL